MCSAPMMVFQLAEEEVMCNAPMMVFQLVEEEVMCTALVEEEVVCNAPMAVFQLENVGNDLLRRGMMAEHASENPAMNYFG